MGERKPRGEERETPPPVAGMPGARASFVIDFRSVVCAARCSRKEGQGSSCSHLFSRPSLLTLDTRAVRTFTPQRLHADATGRRGVGEGRGGELKLEWNMWRLDGEKMTSDSSCPTWRLRL